MKTPGLAAVLVASLMALSCAAPLHAQEWYPRKVEEPEETKPTNFGLSVGSTLAFRADLEDSGSVLVSHSDIGLSLTHLVSDKLTLRGGIRFEYSYYDFSGSVGVEGTDNPFSDVYSLGGSLVADIKLDDTWSLIAGGFIGYSAESGVDIGDAINGGGSFGVGWRINPRLYVAAGVTVQSRLEDDALVTPLIILRWQIDDDTRLETVELSRGGGIGLTRKIDDDWEVTLFGGFQYREFRLDDDNPGRLSDGVVRDTRVPVGLIFAWQPEPNIRLAVQGGAIVYQEYEFRNSIGRKFNEIETDPAAFVGLRLDFTF